MPSGWCREATGGQADLPRAPSPASLLSFLSLGTGPRAKGGQRGSSEHHSPSGRSKRPSGESTRTRVHSLKQTQLSHLQTIH